MKYVGLLLLLMGLAACNQDNKIRIEKLEKENRILREIAGPLPASLDNYFPPKASGSVYLAEMFTMVGQFKSIGIDLKDNDLAGANASFNAFKAQYLKMAIMVPEWKDKFPFGPIDTLGQALNSGDPAKAGPAITKAYQACSSCHLLNQMKAQQKYHWPDFETLDQTDPITKETISSHESMVRLAGAITGIGHELRKGKPENVRRNFQVFSTWFKVMNNSCDACHDSPRAYYSDAKVQDMLKELEKAVAAEPQDAKTIGRLIGGIDNENWMKCHLVHMPPEFTKSLWKTYSDIFK